MNTLTSQSLAQIVTQNHRYAAVMEKYQLDFCCKGKRTLQQACGEQNIRVADMVNELKRISSDREGAFPYDRLTMSQLIDHIVSTHHEYVKTESVQIAVYLQKVASKHGDRHPELRQIFELFTTVKEEMEQHMRKEELILFPRIKEFEKFSFHPEGHFVTDLSYLQAPIQLMEQEHEEAGSMLKKIRQLTNNYCAPQDACTTFKVSFAALEAFEKDLHQHVHLENNILFPKVIELVSDITGSKVV